VVWRPYQSNVSGDLSALADVLIHMMRLREDKR